MSKINNKDKRKILTYLQKVKKMDAASVISAYANMSQKGRARLAKKL